MEDMLFAFHDNRVSRIGPALVSNDNFHPVRQGVDDAALAFVTPLGSDNYLSFTLHCDIPP
jgi:hypothetical protein